jgi:hypothetical protein
VLVASLGLCALIVFFDNANRATTNGLWKSIDVARWVDGTPDRFTDAANLLYYPVIGALVRALPEAAFGTVWQRMAFVNAFLAAIVLALTYALALALFQSRRAALFASLCQLSMGFFLLLATINEDIMPGYLWFVAAIACVVLPRRPGPIALVLAAQCVALAWLFHSSLQLPAIGAFVLAIAAWTGEVRRAAWRLALFCAALVPLPLVCAQLFGLSWSSALWSGKGVGTGWGGFAWNKLVFLWSGVGQSVAGGRNVASVAEVLAYPQVLWTTLTALVVVLLAVSWVHAGWRRRLSPRWRLAATVLGAAFVLGEGMNLYIQPQDPQMQLQPMTWFPFAAAGLASRLERRKGFRAAALRTGAWSMPVLLLSGNVWVYTDSRGADSVALGNIRTLEMLVVPERTVFLIQGFEGMATWLTLSWGRGVEWPTPDPIPAAEHGQRQFNAIYITTEIIIFPDRSPAESSSSVVGLVERALDEGFDVVATDIWAADEHGWSDSLATVTGPERPLAIRAALNERYAGLPLGIVPGWTQLYRIVRKAPAPPPA